MVDDESRRVYVFVEQSLQLNWSIPIDAGTVGYNGQRARKQANALSIDGGITTGSYFVMCVTPSLPFLRRSFLPILVALFV
jgi:hypothetical protein